MKKTVVSVLILEIAFNLWDWLRQNNILISVSMWESRDLSLSLGFSFTYGKNLAEDEECKNNISLGNLVKTRQDSSTSTNELGFLEGAQWWRRE